MSYFSLNRQKAFVLIAVLNVVLFRIRTSVNADDLCAAIITPLNYVCNSYTVATDDGFLLGIYNIPYGRAGPGASSGIPVLLVHGYQGGGDNFVLNPPQQSLATYLADAGFDVWIGNNRNIQWSHGSSKYSTSDKGYWDWTWDELAAYDVPALIQFAYNFRGGTKIFYLGHSQGGLTFIAALTNTASLTAQVTSQLRGAVLLAPFAYNANIQAPLLRLLSELFVDEIPARLGIGPFDTKAEGQLICGAGQQVCQITLAASTGQNSFLNYTRLPYYTKFFPQVTSTENFNHFGQTFRSGLFQKYDRGLASNLIFYGQITPPLYDFSLFPKTLPLQIFTGGLDGLADPIDVQHTLANLPSTSRQVINLPDYGHLDFILSYRAYLDIYPDIVSYMYIIE